MITDVDDYFAKGCGRCARFETPACSTRIWADGLAALRAICLDAGLSETAKWGHPCYMHAGRNIVIIGAFRENFRLTFFKAALMKDPEGVLERQGANSQHPDMIRFTTSDGPAAQASVISAYLAEAKGYAEAGITPVKTTVQPDFPEELATALDDDPELAEAFYALTPGRQRSYLFNLNGAKQSPTRVSRIAKFRDKIIAGKGALER
ncbi:YdeI/OmpD-associated family protein [Celeribacter arenosi]|uniref:YdeI/OmpD-associated family protein n=1 Tax=Celeribacter arenosi TaxID=792649 RepID=A0ABP7KC30_9RHOB